MTKWTVEPGEELIYGALGDTEFVAVVPRRYATQLEAQLTARTWGELRAPVPVDLAGKSLRCAPKLKTAIPLHLTMSSECLTFSDDLERYGEESSVHNGEFFALHVEHLDSLARDLEERGVRCTRMTGSFLS